MKVKKHCRSVHTPPPKKNKQNKQKTKKTYPMQNNTKTLNYFIYNTLQVQIVTILLFISDQI